MPRGKTNATMIPGSAALPAKSRHRRSGAQQAGERALVLLTAGIVAARAARPTSATGRSSRSHLRQPLGAHHVVGGEGLYAVTPRARFVWGGCYEEGALIWRSRWVTGEGLIECREALAFPGDPHRAVLLRRVIAGHNRARVRVRLDPRAEFGRKSLRSLRHGDGWWAGRLGDLYLRWSDDLSGARALRAQPDRPGTGLAPGRH
jgi:hypothetical protein